MPTHYPEVKHTKKTQYIIEEMKKGKKREEIARALNYKSKSGLDMYMRRHHFIWSRQEQCYMAPSPDVLPIPRVRPRVQNTICKKILSLLKKEKDVKQIVQSTGFHSVREMGLFMRNQGYIWSETEKTYIYYGKQIQSHPLLSHTPSFFKPQTSKHPSSSITKDEENTDKDLFIFLKFLKENESSLKNIINMVDKYKSDNKQIIIELSQFSLEAIEYFKKNNKQTTNEIINQAIQHYFTSFFNET